MLRLTGSVGGMTNAQVDALVRAAIAPVQEMAQAANTRALDAEARAEAAEVEAVQAKAIGEQAHTALATTTAEIDTRYDTLEELAASYAQALPASVADRAALHAQLDALVQQVAALQALKVVVAFGSATLAGSLLAGATNQVTVNLSRDMGSTTYSAGYSIAGGSSVLGSLVVDGIVSQTRTTVVLRVRNAGLTSLVNLTGAAVHVVTAREA